ncbi:MAG: restriction endonuclease [Aigarchaeota archaeon]|nr:restriction endonuclease [Candidatus Pelearchaeum maunauluense]
MNQRIISEVLVAVLQLSKNGATPTPNAIAELAGVGRELVTEAIRMYVPNLEILSPDTRVELMLEAVKLGYEPERVARYLDWREMEAYTAKIVEKIGYKPLRNVRFKRLGKRFEVDVLAVKEYGAIVLDCKRWKNRLVGKTLRSVVERHKARTEALVSLLENALTGRNMVSFLPTILTLYEPETRMAEGCYIVPIHTFMSFLSNADAIIVVEGIRTNLRKGWTEELRVSSLLI